jgi:hypothetical protein
MEPETASKKESGEYWAAYEQWKKLDFKLDAFKPFTREEAHERPVCRERA